jgi:hypothetical protein
MSRIKEHYHEEICKGMESRHLDDDYHFKAWLKKEESQQLVHTPPTDDPEWVEEEAGKAEMERIASLTGKYPI